MHSWSYENPRFECDEINGDLLIYAPWSGHRNFIYDFLKYYTPRTVVELGSHYGCSSFAILQAVKDCGLDTEFYAIDTWEGDSLTLYSEGENVLEFYKKINETYYQSQKSFMLRMTFDSALSQFAEKTIDVLHIDGSHEYNDVKHDYEMWKNKMADDGIILFHDISQDKVLGNIMGSHIFWEELKKEYPYTCEFDFSFGLGILFFSESVYEDFKNKVDMQRYQRINNELSVNYKDVIRKKHFELLDKTNWNNSLQREKKILENDNTALLCELDNVKEQYEETILGKENYIHELEDMIAVWKNKVKTIQDDYESTIIGKENYICELENTIGSWKNEVEKIRHDYELTINGKDKYIAELEHRLVDG